MLVPSVLYIRLLAIPRIRATTTAKKTLIFLLSHTVPIVLRFSQSAYSQSESVSPLSVSLVLDASSGVAVQAVVAQITASAQGGDTATGKEICGFLLLLECVN